jgi:hypothetical protein
MHAYWSKSFQPTHLQSCGLLLLITSRPDCILLRFPKCTPSFTTHPYTVYRAGSLNTDTWYLRILNLLRTIPARRAYTRWTIQNPLTNDQTKKYHFHVNWAQSINHKIKGGPTELAHNFGAVTESRSSSSIIHKDSHYIPITKPNRLMLFGETVAVYCENRTEHTNTLWNNIL